jgi:hypothetical protein
MATKVDGTNGVIQSYDYQVLTTGFSYTFSSGIQTLVINPAGALATGTVTMPSAPSDGMVVTVTSTQPINALTVNANTGQTISNGGSVGLQAGGCLAYMYNLANTKWQPFNAGLPIGIGQTWQNMAASRAVATTYTNSTGRPIFVSVGLNTSATGTLYATVSSLTMAGTSVPSAGYATNISFIVPTGGTYSVTINSGSPTISTWLELR